MNRVTKLVLIALVSIMVVGLAGASEYPFGSKVMPGDSDLGKPLFQLPVNFPLGWGTTVRYWETGVIPGYDNSDVVYLHIPRFPQLLTVATVVANDVRLTPFGDLPAGSKVTPQDNDIGQPSLPLPGGASIRYLDLYGSPQYDFMDPVYVHLGSPPPDSTIVRDVRLTEANGLEPGTKVRNFDLDSNKRFGVTPPIITPLPQPVLPPVRIRFFDANGNGVYDYPDDVYLNFPTTPARAVVVNNIRLSGPIS
jgi:hypothetical protein